MQTLKQANFTQNQANFTQNQYHGEKALLLGVVIDSEEGEKEAYKTIKEYVSNNNITEYTCRVDQVWSGHSGGYFLTVAILTEKSLPIEEVIEYGFYEDDINGATPVVSRKSKRIEVIIPEIHFAYNKNACNVDDPNFFLAGTFIGLPYAEETKTKGKWKVIFKHPDTCVFYTDTYTWTHIHPLKMSRSDKDIINNQISNI